MLKKLGRVQRMWGIVTFFVHSHFFTSLNFLKDLKTSYALDIVWVGKLYVGGGQMIFEKIKIKIILKN